MERKNYSSIPDIERLAMWKEIIATGKMVLKLKGHDIPLKCVDGRGYEWTPDDVKTMEEIIKEAKK